MHAIATLEYACRWGKEEDLAVMHVLNSYSWLDVRVRRALRSLLKLAELVLALYITAFGLRRAWEEYRLML